MRERVDDALQNATTPVSCTTGARADPAVLATLATAATAKWSPSPTPPTTGRPARAAPNRMPW
ncbi:hypothetical protein [Streptomyces wuyuanensis]|uniref:hypothetical protein n=1 Tax=Streptomyces wuyuanensis TaxID=1196353 RepID=UPI00371825CE